MTSIWVFLIIMIAIHLASDWLPWTDTGMQWMSQFISLGVIVLTTFGLGMGYRAEKAGEYRPPKNKPK